MQKLPKQPPRAAKPPFLPPCAPSTSGQQPPMQYHSVKQPNSKPTEGRHMKLRTVTVVLILLDVLLLLDNLDILPILRLLFEVWVPVIPIAAGAVMMTRRSGFSRESKRHKTREARRLKRPDQTTGICAVTPKARNSNTGAECARNLYPLIGQPLKTVACI